MRDPRRVYGLSVNDSTDITAAPHYLYQVKLGSRRVLAVASDAAEAVTLVLEAEPPDENVGAVVINTQLEVERVRPLVGTHIGVIGEVPR